MYGYFIKRNDTDFVINVNYTNRKWLQRRTENVDKWNAYNVAEVQAMPGASRDGG